MNYHIAYRQIDDWQGAEFERLQIESSTRVLRDQILPGLYGHKDIHIKWHRFQFGGDTLHLLAYTHEALSPEAVKDIGHRAYLWATGRAN